MFDRPPSQRGRCPLFVVRGSERAPRAAPQFPRDNPTDGRAVERFKIFVVIEVPIALQNADPRDFHPDNYWTSI